MIYEAMTAYLQTDSATSSRSGPEPLAETLRRAESVLADMMSGASTAGDTVACVQIESSGELPDLPDLPEEGDGKKSLPEALTQVFRPGAVFKGHIFIPGASERAEYEMRVLRADGGDLAEAGPICVHCAHGDEQVCQLRPALMTDGDNGALPLEYADAETHCRGLLKIEEGELRGSVSQLSGEEGFWAPSGETHQFELRLLTEEEDVRAGRAAEYTTAETILATLATAWRRTLDQGIHSDQIKVRESLQGLFWRADCGALLAAAVLHSEELACRFRTCANWLQGLEFCDELHKRRSLASLGDTWTRETCHRRMEAATDRLKVVFLGVQDFTNAELGRGGDQLDGSRLLQQAFEQRRRLALSYASFDKALRSAEKRPPLSELARWRRPGDICSGFCSICQVDSEGAALVLGCGHRFHETCATRWLQVRPYCPNCRWSHDVEAAQESSSVR